MVSSRVLTVAFSAMVGLGALGGCGAGLGGPSVGSDTPPDWYFAESFENGGDDEDVTDENSSFNVIENAPATFEVSPTPVEGSFVGRYLSTGDYIRTKVEFADEGVTTVYERAYLWIDEYPSALMRFLTLETSPNVEPPGEDVLALRLDKKGHLHVYDGKEFTEANITEQPLPLDEWVRLEVSYDKTQGRYGASVVRLFTGSDLGSSVPDVTITVEHVAEPSHPVTTAGFGVLNLVTVDFSLDAIAAAPDDWVGPVLG